MMIRLTFDEAQALQALRAGRVSRAPDGTWDAPAGVRRDALDSLNGSGYLRRTPTGLVALTPAGLAVATPPLLPHLRRPARGIPERRFSPGPVEDELDQERGAA